METVSGNLASALKIEPGITAIIGSGGKSTLLKTLGLELMRAGGRVLLCTTTHMFPVAGVPWDGSSRRLDSAPWKPGALHVPGCTCEACAGMNRGSICQAGVLDPETGKLSAPAEPLNELAQRFDYVLAEADGSKQLPLKAHAAWEPVIPSGTADIATPERVAQVLNAELRMLNLSNARIMLNQVDTLADPTMADRFETALGRSVVATSLK